MFGREVFKFDSRGSRRTELRGLIRENIVAAASVIRQQRNALVNAAANVLNTVVEMPPGWKRYGHASPNFRAENFREEASRAVGSDANVSAGGSGVGFSSFGKNRSEPGGNN